ncbi:MAG: NAD(P)-dependent dehydrogenase (short-subunit alcohol dehydrogenase family), partial [Alphaproteobacteria bacterium]
MPSVMVIGASRGIGLELARQYADAGWHVHATTRALQRPGKLG